MKITALAENTASGPVKAVHGLSLYIETEKHRLLFDLGPDDTIFENAKRLQIDLTAVDTVVISHGHYDHGGALKQFLAINPTARVYIQKSAFQPYYNRISAFEKYIGLDPELAEHPSLILLEGDHVIDEELSLFTAKAEDPIHSKANEVLFVGEVRDSFRHEQNLLIRENKKVLLMGCGHSGVISILRSLPGGHPDVCIGGFHVYSPAQRKTVPPEQLEKLSRYLEDYRDVEFFTCHCTGQEAYDYLHARNESIRYLACGSRREF